MSNTKRRVELIERPCPRKRGKYEKKISYYTDLASGNRLIILHIVIVCGINST